VKPDSSRRAPLSEGTAPRNKQSPGAEEGAGLQVSAVRPTLPTSSIACYPWRPTRRSRPGSGRAPVVPHLRSRAPPRTGTSRVCPAQRATARRLPPPVRRPIRLRIANSASTTACSLLVPTPVVGSAGHRRHCRTRAEPDRSAGDCHSRALGRVQRSLGSKLRQSLAELGEMEGGRHVGGTNAARAPEAQGRREPVHDGCRITPGPLCTESAL